ncbi:MAG: COG3178: Predicted phosphotransferase related to Ser/Thr protein kinases [uncultured Thiotrichaceae bacterium]|uniref:COG3178: Predicted phosphotransferase related to Ser/Thr protein kinases n=1 Tax=uncultured Thiotrichaceae bacterium TaxID=298394 RepID=A0A6S6TYQ1_9GAMM|nr:MAG: COG3178: Predicted phosphotransferase related to Ser/Thr protein kinases [uncultured Thiotrichaceae bacterium]
MIDMDQRLAELTRWVQEHLEWKDAQLAVASADASFRRYFRVTYNNQTFIAMDAPPEKEAIQPFIDITNVLLKTATHVPEIIAQNTERGFLILEDLGNTPYLDKLNASSADALYHDAFDALIQMQEADITSLPAYDEQRLHDELLLMPEWFLKTHLDIELTENEQSVIASSFSFILQEIAQQPSTHFVHRDYHSRNLMMTSERNPGVIDYQDAVSGPISYDLVSLLRDCYIHWPQSQVETWALQFRDKAIAATIISDIDDSSFLKNLDIMGLQRHIKVLGIFCRLAHRDGKIDYLNDLPLTLSYVLDVARRYPEMQALLALFDRHNIPAYIGTNEISA